MEKKKPNWNYAIIGMLLVIAITEGMMLLIMKTFLSQRLVFQGIQNECLPANQNGTYTCSYELPKGCIDGYYLQPFKNEGFEYSFQCTFNKT